MIFDGKLYLNLEKQVQKNKEDIEFIINQEGALNQFGLRVVGQVETISDMPTIQAYKESNPNWEYGDAFMVGASTAEATVVDVDNATLLVLTRANTVYPNDFWMNLGKFPKPGPVGPKGEQGEQGIQGEHGLNVESGTGLPAIQAPQGTTYINATTGDVYRRYNNIWQLIGNIKGATGSVGPAGPQGKTGPIGQTGATGAQGPRGIGVNILGTLTSTSQLPNPTTVGKDSAYIIPADGVNHLWVIEGTDNLVWTDFGTAGRGEKGDKGDAGVGINTMTDLDLTYGNTTVTYDTTDGMTINGQARFTYDGGTTKDVTMDIEVPIVAGDGITIDKVNGQEKVEVKLDYVSASDVILGGPLAKRILVREGQTTDYMDFGQITADAIAQYTYEAKLQAVTDDEEITDPNTDAVLVNRAYAKKHYVPNLINPTVRSVPMVDKDSSGNWYNGWVRFEDEAIAWSLPRRVDGGVVRVGTPVGVNDATPKAYVDGLHHYSHHVKLDLLGASVGASSTASICMTVASKNAPNAVSSLNDITVTTSLAYLLYYLGEEVEGWEFSSTGYIKHNGIMYMVYALYVDIDYKISASCINLSTMEQADFVLTDIYETWQVIDFVA